MKLSIVGIGPGNDDFLTPGAIKAIKEADVIAGYDVYVDLVKHMCGDKKIISTGMKKEVDRCRMAIDEAAAGNKVALVCSGDAGVYGLAGLIYELVDEPAGIEIEVIPGITAACSAAAVLGAPLIHDFAVISLSDLLTPWEKIEKRLRLAAEADFVICLYNPRSKKRREHLDNAVAIIMEHRSGSTPCGYVKNIARDGEKHALCTIDKLPDEDIDMFTTIIIGNSQTYIKNGKLVTPRGYTGI